MKIESLYGMEIVVDPTVPEGEVQLRDKAGKVLGRIVTRTQEESENEKRREGNEGA